MDANDIVTIIGGIIVALPGIAALYLQWRKEKRTAPLEDAGAAVSTSAAAAAALRSYSEEIGRLRTEVAGVREELDVLRRDLDLKNAVIDEWRAGINRLIAQLVSLNAKPVWQPRTAEDGDIPERNDGSADYRRKRSTRPGGNG